MKVFAAVCVLLSLLGIGSCLECLVCSDPSRDCKEVTKFTCTEVEGTDSWCYSIASVSGLVQKFCHNAPVGATADQVCDDLQVAAGDTKLSSCSACKSDLCNEQSAIAKINTRATIKCHGCPDGDPNCAAPTEADCVGTADDPIPYCYTILSAVEGVPTLKKGCHLEPAADVSSEDVCAKLTGGLIDPSCVACEGTLCNTNKIPTALKCLTCSFPADKTCALAPSTDCKPTLHKPHSYCYSVRGQDAAGDDLVSRGCHLHATELATDAAVCTAVEAPKQTGCNSCRVSDCIADVPPLIVKCHGCPAGDATCAAPTEIDCAGTTANPFPYCYSTLETLAEVPTLKKGCHLEPTAGVSSEDVCAKLTGGLTDPSCVACEGPLCNTNKIPTALKCLTCSVPTDKTCALAPSTDCKPTLLKPHSYCYSVRGQDAGGDDLVSRGCHIHATELATDVAVCTAVEQPKQSGCNSCRVSDCIADVPPLIVKCHGCPAGDATCAAPTEIDCAGTTANPFPYCYSTLETLAGVPTLKKGCHVEATTGVSSEDVCAKLTGGLIDPSCVACEGPLCNTNKIPTALKCLTCSVPTDKTCALAPSADCKPTLHKPHSYCYSVRGQDAAGDDLVSRGCHLHATELATDAAVCTAVEAPKQTGCNSCRVSDCIADVPPVPLECYKCTDAGDTTCETDKISCTAADGEKAVCFTNDVNVLEGGATKQKVEKGCKSVAADLTKEAYCEALKPGTQLVNTCHFCEEPLCNKKLEIETITCKACAAGSATCSDVAEDITCAGTDALPIPYCYSALGTVANVKTLRKNCVRSDRKGLTSEEICGLVTETDMSNMECLGCDRASCNVDIFPETIKCRECSTTADKACATTKTVDCAAATLAKPRANCYQATGTDEFLRRGCFYSPKDTISSEAICALVQEVHPGELCTACRTERCNEPKTPSTLKCYTCKNKDDKDCKEEMAENEFCTPEHDEESRCSTLDYNLPGDGDDTWVVAKGCVSVLSAVTEEAYCKAAEGVFETVNKCTLCDEDYCNGAASMAAGFLITLVAVFAAIMH